MEFLVWLEATSLATWVRESSSLWAYPLVITLHTLGLSMLVGGAAAIALRLLGLARDLPLAPLARLFPLIWMGGLVNAVSGVLLFMAGATSKGVQVVFWIKLACIALGMINLRKLQTRVFTDRVALESGLAPRQATRLAATSMLLWTGAIAAGRLMAYL